MFGLKKPKKLKYKGMHKSGSSDGADRLFLIGVGSGFVLLMWGIFDGAPMPSNFSWQMVLGAFVAMAFLLAQSSIYMFKEKSPVMVGRHFKASLWSTEPVQSATAIMNGRTVMNDIWLLEGFRAFHWYAEGGKKNGVAIVPRHFWHRGGLTVPLGADCEKVLWDVLPASIQKKLNKLNNFNKDTSPIFWFRIPNNMFRYTIELHAKEKIIEQIKDLIATADSANQSYNDVVELLNSLRETFDIQNNYMRKGKRYAPKSPREEESYD